MITPYFFPLCCSFYIPLWSPALYSVYNLQYSHINIPKEVKLSHALHQRVNVVFTRWNEHIARLAACRSLAGESSPVQLFPTSGLLLLTDEGEASRLREPGTGIRHCPHLRHGEETGRRLAEGGLRDRSMWCWRNEPTRQGRSPSTGPRERPGPGTPEKN